MSGGAPSSSFARWRSPASEPVRNRSARGACTKAARRHPWSSLIEVQVGELLLGRQGPQALHPQHHRRLHTRLPVTRQWHACARDTHAPQEWCLRRVM
eukprot:CAMPEP_0185556482 /NCGR_PEP_ID=MMETSP1381-20130426/47296_1 /TAXON_ID=298111 /ORGANISM="Pavlova sp., Strain CCMP459" /LENGTH=97 /DNA_ID=CAMNT_0028169865 /DNA_START=167 /DNA_END=460 /DNA_ORIENTATION=-